MITTQDLNHPSSTVRSMDGSLVAASQMLFASNQATDKKLLIVIQYYDGDRQQTEELCDLIADLERIRNKAADVMLFCRNDTRINVSIGTVNRLRDKFDTVYVERSRRIGAAGYPYGPNEMFYDLMCKVGKGAKMREKYFAVLNLASDCCPTRPGWVTEITKEYRVAQQNGKLILGHFCDDHPTPHVNGVAVYSTDLLAKIGETKLMGGPATSPYDLHLGKTFLPLAHNSNLIYLEFQRPTIKAVDLFSAKKNGVVPAIFHGVKDSSARSIVRATHITLSASGVADNTVFTYFDTVDQIDANGQREQIELWKSAWSSSGFNPVVLGLREVKRNPLYAKFLAAVEALPTANPKQYELNCFLRWLALDSMGGGLMSDYDVLPSRLVPSEVPESIKPGMFNVFQIHNACPSLVYADRKALATWMKYIIGYKVRPEDTHDGKPHVSDQSIVQYAEANDTFVNGVDKTTNFGNTDWKAAAAVHFSSGSVAQHRPGMSKQLAMREFLQGI